MSWILLRYGCACEIVAAPQLIDTHTSVRKRATRHMSSELRFGLRGFDAFWTLKAYGFLPKRRRVTALHIHGRIAIDLRGRCRVFWWCRERFLDAPSRQVEACPPFCS